MVGFFLTPVDVWTVSGKICTEDIQRCRRSRNLRITELTYHIHSALALDRVKIGRLGGNLTPIHPGGFKREALQHHLGAVRVVRVHPDAFDFVAFDGLTRRRDVPVELFVVFVPLDGVEPFVAAFRIAVVVVVMIDVMPETTSGIVPGSTSLHLAGRVMAVAIVGLLAFQFVLTLEQGRFAAVFVWWDVNRFEPKGQGSCWVERGKWKCSLLDTQSDHTLTRFNSFSIKLFVHQLK